MSWDMYIFHDIRDPPLCGLPGGYISYNRNWEKDVEIPTFRKRWACSVGDLSWRLRTVVPADDVTTEHQTVGYCPLMTHSRFDTIHERDWQTPRHPARHRTSARVALCNLARLQSRGKKADRRAYSWCCFSYSPSYSEHPFWRCFRSRKEVEARMTSTYIVSTEDCHHSASEAVTS